MKAQQKTTRKKAPASALPKLTNHISFALAEHNLSLLRRLAQEQSDLIGRRISPSAVLRSLLPLADQKISAIELRDRIEEEIQQGRKWGKDSARAF